MTNPMSSSEMMQQLSQMSSIQTMTDLQAAITNMNDIAVTNYSASLVGKEVTVAVEDSEGKLQTITGTVTGSGLYSGETIVFVDGKAYSLSQVMAIGKIPDDFLKEEEDGDTTTDTDNSTDTDNNTDTDNSTNTDNDTNTDTGDSSGSEGTEETKPEA